MCNMYKIRIKFSLSQIDIHTHARDRCINDYRIAVIAIRTNSSSSKSVCVNVDDEFDDF
jgi:hypothetical protein